MARIDYINKERHAEKVLELFMEKREGFIEFVLDLLSSGVSAGETEDRLLKEVKAEMKRTIFDYLKRSGAVRGEYRHLYTGGYYRRTYREPRITEVPFGLLDMEKILPDFRELVSRIVEDAEKRRMIERIEATTLKNRYDSVGDFRNGLARVAKDGKHGYIDTTGREVIPCRYAILGFFDHGPASASLEPGGPFGFLDETGREVCPFKYDFAYDFRDGMAKVWRGGKCGFIDKSGREVPRPENWGKNGR